MSVYAAAAAGAAAVTVAGALMAAAGIYGAVPAQAPFRSRLSRVRTSGTRTAVLRRSAKLAGGAAAGLGVWLLSGWPVAGLLVVAGAVGLPYFFGAGKLVRARIERLEALEEWVRRLADTMAAGTSAVQAIVRSADHAPIPIKAEVVALANGLSTPRLDRTVVLRRFADAIDDALGDMVAMALEIAVSAQASQHVPDVLRMLADGVSEEVKARRAVEADRAGPRKETFQIVIVEILLVTVAAMASYTAVYGTPMGQLVLAVLGAVSGLALYLLRRYSVGAPPPRILSAQDVGAR